MHPGVLTAVQFDTKWRPKCAELLFFLFSNGASDPSVLILIWGEHLFPISFSSVLRGLDLLLQVSHHLSLRAPQW